ASNMCINPITQITSQKQLKFLPDNPYIAQKQTYSHTVPESDNQYMVVIQNTETKVEEPGSVIADKKGTNKLRPAMDIDKHEISGSSPVWNEDDFLDIPDQSKTTIVNQRYRKVTAKQFAKIEIGLSFEKLRAEIRHIITEELVKLLDHPELIPETLMYILPFDLLIVDRHNTTNVVKTMRQLFKFSTLLDTYFVNVLSPLPDEPDNLERQWRDMFPIKDHAELKKNNNNSGQTRMERTIDNNVLAKDNQQPLKIKNQKPFERNPAEPLKIITHNASSTHALINSLYKIYMANCDEQIAKTRKAKNTWSGRGSANQIDNFWISKGILLQLAEPKLTLAENITESDHKIVATELPLVYPLKNKRRKKIKRKRYLYDRMSKEDWQNFAKSLEDKVEER
ncbi:8014_t:CDS:2, partial [Gigaspora rosea]